MADYSFQPGDEVYVLTYFRRITTLVERVTSTQIVTEIGKYRRNDGVVIGSGRGLRLLSKEEVARG